MIAGFIIGLVIGVLGGFWIKNQLNEGKNPFMTIWEGLEFCWFHVVRFFHYLFSRIPKNDSMAEEEDIQDFLDGGPDEEPTGIG